MVGTAAGVVNARRPPRGNQLLPQLSDDVVESQRLLGSDALEQELRIGILGIQTERRLNRFARGLQITIPQVRLRQVKPFTLSMITSRGAFIPSPPR